MRRTRGETGLFFFLVEVRVLADVWDEARDELCPEAEPAFLPEDSALSPAFPAADDLPALRLDVVFFADGFCPDSDDGALSFALASALAGAEACGVEVCEAGAS